MAQKTINQDLKKIVVERLRRMPSHLQVSIGGTTYSTDQLVDSVDSGNQLGKTIADIHLQYLQDLASGKLFADE